jgi:hypothetical protein
MSRIGFVVRLTAVARPSAHTHHAMGCNVRGTRRSLEIHQRRERVDIQSSLRRRRTTMIAPNASAATKRPPITSGSGEPEGRDVTADVGPTSTIFRLDLARADGVPPNECPRAEELGVVVDTFEELVEVAGAAFAPWPPADVGARADLPLPGGVVGVVALVPEPPEADTPVGGVVIDGVVGVVFVARTALGGSGGRSASPTSDPKFQYSTLPGCGTRLITPSGLTLQAP